MAEATVRELRVRVRASRGGEALRAAAERFARAVLEAAVESLERRHPGRVWRVRELPLRWSLGARALGSDGAEAIASCAADLAETIAHDAVSAGLDQPFPAREARAVVFAEEAERRALHLVSRGEGRAGHWCFADLEAAADPLLALAADASSCRLCLTRITAAGLIENLLPSWPLRTVEALLRTLITPPATGAPRDAAPIDAILRRLRARHPAWPRLAPARRRLLALLAPAELVPRHGETMAALWEACGQDEAPDPDGGVAAEPIARVERTGGDGATAHAGLVYWLLPWLELGVGEALWKACLAEPPLLACALAAVPGVKRDDPAVAAFAGAAASPASPLSEEQAAEVVDAALAALAEAVPRRGLARLPPLRLALRGGADGRLLVGMPEGLPFAVASWPAPDAAAVREAVARAAARWRAPLLAEPAVSALAPQLGSAPIAPMRIGGSDLPDLLAGIAATLLALRAGLDPGAVAALAAIPGTLADDGETLTVSMPIERIELALRRVGLDRDPGWVPWLKRAVRIVFVGGEEPS